MPSDRFSPEDDEKLIEIVSGYSILWNMAHSDWKNHMKKDLVWIEVGSQLEKTSSHCKLRWRSIRDHYRKQRKHEKGMPTGSAAAKKRATYWDRLDFLDSVEDERRTFSNANMQDVETPAGYLEDPDDPLESEQLNPSSSQLPLSQSSKDVPPPLPCSQTVPASSPSEDLNPFRKPPTKKAKTTKEKSVLKELVAERRHDREHLQKYLGKIMENEPEDENDLFFKSMAQTVKKFKPALIAQAKKKIFAIVMDLEEENRGTSNNYGLHFSPLHYPEDRRYYTDSASSSVQSPTASSLNSTPFQQYPIDEPQNLITKALHMALSPLPDDNNYHEC
ncbi:hypothetical protein GE061_016379 [Apolygus lucorum]|uniref:Uncharacterized protein n=1 Tax=Apolygus lucorum TaxID=248454 RepID=A0A6A4K7A0_APOLU|nr:hypothetical protein GE061_016379 [Apolygus lucorum]